LEAPATTLEMTEDGLFVLVAHEAADKLTVYDVKAGKVLKTVSCPAPRHILCRGGKAYVANFGKGTISVLDPAKDWAPANQVLAGDKEIYYLSAPGGKYFRGQILACCGASDGQKPRAFVVDVAKDQATEITGGHYAGGVSTFSFDGESVVQQHNFGGSPSGLVASFQASEYIAPKGFAKSVRGEHEVAPFLYQVREGAFWFGYSGIYGGIPPRKRTGKPGDLVLADYTRSMVYVLNKGELTAYQLNAALPVAGSARIEVRDESRRENYALWVSKYPRSVFHHPVAATHGATTSLFVCDEQNHKVLAGSLELAAAGAAPTAAAKKGEFAPMALDDAATAMAMTEDGACLVVAHRGSGKVSIWDVKAGKTIKSVACPSPEFVLCRGGKAFVVNGGRGTVSVLDPAKDWALSDQLLAGDNDVTYLSAPGGKYFRGQLLAVGGKYGDRRVFLLEAGRDSAKQVRKQVNMSVATFSYDGEAVIEQSEFDHSPGGTVMSYKATDYLSGQPGAPIHGEHENTPLLWQVRQGSFWLGPRGVYAGIPPRAFGLGNRDDLIFPDLARPVLYVLNGNQLTMLRFDAAQTKLGSGTVSFSPQYPKAIEWKYLRAPLAATHGPTTHLFMLDAKNQLLFQCAVDLAATEAVAGPAGTAGGEMTTLGLEETATGMTMTEDGGFVAVAHEPAGKVSIWDVKAGKVARVVTCPAPRHLLSRGGRLYVANCGKGTISVLDPAKDWTLTDQILCGVNEVCYLSAPGGTNFKGQILVSGGKPDDRRFYTVDTTKDAARQVPGMVMGSWATFSYNGESIIQQGSFSSSPSGTVTGFRAAEFLAGDGRGTSGEHESTPFLHQPRGGQLWMGRSSLYAGVPPKRFGQDHAGLLVPDLTQPVFYVQDGETVTAYELSAATRQLSDRRIKLSDRYPKTVSYFGANTLSPPAAATLGDTTYFFVFDEKAQSVFHWRTGAGGGTVAGTPARAPGPENFPARVAVGSAIFHPLYDREVKGAFTVVNGPKGLSVSEKGVVSWTPDAADAGPQQVKIKAEVDGQVAFLRLSTEVVSADLAARLGGDPSKAADLGVHYIFADGYDLRTSLDGQSMLLLTGKKMDLLDADGLTVRRSLEFKSSYLRIGERADSYLALAGDSLDVLDKNTLAVRRHIALPGSNATDLAVNPARRETYVAVFDKEGGTVGKLEAKRVAMVNEDAGTARLLPRVYGQWLAVHPSGKFLYTSLKDMYQAGYRIDWYIGEVMPNYGNIDIMVSYDISGDGVQHRQTNLEPGANGRAMRISPDGAHVSYVSGGGYRAGPDKLNGYTIPAFTAEDIRVAKVAYKTDAYPVDVSYHPVLGLVAACNGKEVRIFERQSGDILAGKLDLKDAKLSKIQRVYFTPGGNHLLVDCNDGSGKQALRAFALRLSEAEKRELAARRPAAPGVPAAPLSTPAAPGPRPEKPANVPPNEIEALGGARLAPMDAKEIGRQFMDAVVVIRSEGGSGTGFVVGSKGYVLTCAHVVPMLGDLTVSYRKREGETVTMTSVKAAVLSLDQKRDLALLKISIPRELPVVRLETGGKPETGEPVTVIGNPGLGEKILDYTMTQGIVSSPQRQLDGQGFVQTSAAINPGCSGGPMFNAKGNVVGLAVLKARIENTGFAVPAEDLMAFLKSCTAGSSPPPPAAPDGRTPEQICAAWLNMADNFQRSGLPDKAREYLRKIVDNYPNTEQAKKAREKLKGL
jgi:serine protease Do